MLLVLAGFFRTADKARKKLRKLRKRKKVKLVGLVQLKDGRPEQLWARWNVPAELAQHEAEVTWFLVMLKNATRIVRGWEVDDFKPDAMAWVGDELYYVEHDRDHMGYSPLLRRMEDYEKCEGIVLWLCPRRARMEGMIRRAKKLPEAVRSLFLFALYEDAVRNPHAEIWEDCDGNRVPI